MIKVQTNWMPPLIQVYCSKHSISETQVMEQRIFSFSIKEDGDVTECE